MFFELLYLDRAIAFAEKHPRETVAAVTAVVITSQFANAKAVKSRLEAAKIERECELIRLETAKIEAENRRSM